MKPVEWKTYRTRFLVKAKQLSSALSFTDHLGRQHCGRKGDYLVESAEGVLSIAPRQIFEDIYVHMPCRNEQASPRPYVDSHNDDFLSLQSFRMESVGFVAGSETWSALGTPREVSRPLARTLPPLTASTSSAAARIA